MRETDPNRKRGATFTFSKEQIEIALAVLARQEKEVSK